MSWFGSASEWKQGLSSIALSKVEELESQAEKLKRERLQKQNQIDTLHQAFDKQKRKTEEEVKQRQSLEKEIEHLERTCEVLQTKLKKGNNDTTASISDSFNLGTEKILRKRIQELENEIKNVQNKAQEGPVKASNDQSQSDPFWSRFSSAGTEGALPAKSPCKVMVKKALETSEENPFRTPASTPHKKGLEISEENPFKTPRKYASATCLPSAPSSASKSDGTLQLEKKLESALQEIEDLKRKQIPPAAPSDASSQCAEISSLKTLLEKTQAEHSAQEQQLQSTNDQLSSFKAKAQDLEVKVEALEQRVKFLQTELDCQRQNSETAKHHLEDRLKEKEREFNAEASRFQKEIAESELKLRELSTKLQQQEALSLSNQNSLQASLDKVSAQLSNVEKEKIVTQNRCSQLETSVNKLEKSEEDAKTMVTQLRQDKEMVKAQVDSLKVKLSESESLANRLQSQLAASEQRVFNQKASIEEITSTHKSEVEKEKQTHKTALETIASEHEKVLRESKAKISILEKELNAIKEHVQTAQKEKDDAFVKLKQTEEDCLQRLSGVNELEAKCKDLESSMDNKEKEFQDSKSQFEKEIEILKATLETMKEEEKANSQELIQKIVEEKKQELSDLQQKATEMEDQLSLSQKNEEKIRGEKLAVELNMWELEGKIEALTKAESSHQEQKQEFMEKIFKLEDALQEVKNSLSSKETEVETLNKSLQEASNTIVSLVSTLEGVKTNLATSDQTVAQMTEKINVMTEEINEKNSTIETLSQEKSSIETTLTETRASYEKVIEEKLNIVKLHEANVEELLRVKENLISKVEAQSTQLSTSHNEYKILKENFDKNVKENDSVISDLESKLEAIKRENDSLKLLENTVSELMENKKTLTETASQREEHIRQLKEVVQTLTTTLSERESTLMKVDEERNVETQKYKSEIDSLIQSNATMEKNLSESAESIIQSEKLIKLLQDENESLSQTVSEANKNLSQLTSSNEALKQTVDKATSECESLTSENEKLISKLDDLGKDYEIVKVNLEKTQLKLSQELVLSQEKADQYNNESKLVEELKASLDSIKEQHSAAFQGLKKDKENLLFELTEERLNKEQLVEELEIYKEKLETEKRAAAVLSEAVKEKESRLTEMSKAAAEVRDDFDSSLAKLNEKLKTALEEMNLKEERYQIMEQENTKSSALCNELREKLNHQETVNRNLSQEFESYREVANLMRRETTSQEDIMNQNNSLQSENKDLTNTVNSLGKKILELQRKNCELSSVQKGEVRDSETQANDLPLDMSCHHSSDIEELEKELGEQELEAIDMGEIMQDLLADFDKLQKENEDLKRKLEEASSVKGNDSSVLNSSWGESAVVESLKDELNQAKLDLKRSKEKCDFNLNLAQELDEKVESLRNELNVKISEEKDLRKELESLKDSQQMEVKKEEFEKLKESMESLGQEHKKLEQQLTVARSQLEDSVPRDKVSLKERELSELTQELICVNGQLEAKNNDLTKENTKLLALKDMLSTQVEERLRQSTLYERDIQNLQRKMDELIDENCSLSSEINVQKKTLEELETERSSVVDSNKKLLGENTDLIHQIDTMREKNKLLNEEIRQFTIKSNKEKDERVDGEVKARTKETENLMMQLDALQKKVAMKETHMKQVVTDLEDNFQIRITELLSMKDTAEKQNEKLQQEISQLQAGLTELKQTNEEKDEKIEKLESSLRAQKDMENSLKQVQDKNEELQLKLDSTLKENDSYVKEVGNLKLREAELSTACEDLKLKLESIEKEKEKLTETFHELKTKCDALGQEVEATSCLKSIITSLEADIAKLRDETEELKTEIVKLNEEKKSNFSETKEKEEMIAKQQKDLLNLKAKLELRIKQDDELNRQIESLEATENELNQKLEEISKQRSEALSRLTATEISLKERESELSSLKEEKNAVIEENVGLNMLKTELLVKIKTQEEEAENGAKRLKEELKTAKTSLNNTQVALETTRKEKGNLEKEKDSKICELELSFERTNDALTQLQQTLDRLTSEKLDLERNIEQLKKENCALTAEKDATSQDLSRTSEEKKSIELESDELRKEHDDLMTKYEEAQNLMKEQKTRLEVLSSEVKTKEDALSEANSKAQAILKELTEAKEELEVEKENFHNKCTENAILTEDLKKKDNKLKESNLRVDEAEESMESLKAKFSLNQTTLRKKEKELTKAQGLIEKLEQNDKKMKSKLKEIHSATKAKEIELADANKEIKHWQQIVEEKSAQLTELSSKFSECEKKAEVLQDKLDKLRLRNKSLELEVSKAKGPKKLLQQTETPSGSCAKETQQSVEEVVASSQTQGKPLDAANLETTLKRAVTRRAAMMGETSTTSTTTATKKGSRRSSGRKSLVKVLEEDQKQASQKSGASSEQESGASFDSHSTRRITRSFTSSGGEKRDFASSREEMSSKRIRLADWEGFPDKTRRGLNDLSEAQRSPGVITRPTTPLKKKADDLSRGPLKLLDTNFDRRRNPSLAKEEIASTAETSSPSSSKKQRPGLDVNPKETADAAELTNKRNLLSRATLNSSKGGALRTRKTLRSSNNGEDCKTQ